MPEKDKLKGDNSQPDKLAAVMNHCALLETIFNGSPIHLYLISKDDRFLYINSAASKAIGLAEKEILGRTWHEIGLPAEQMDKLEADRLRAVSSGEEVETEVGFPTAKGARFIQCQIVPLEDGSTVITSIDITAQRRLEKELTALDQITDSTLSSLKVPELMDNVLRTLLSIMQADAATILLRERDRLIVRAGVGIDQKVVNNFSIEVGEGFSGAIAQIKMPLYADDVEDDLLVLNPGSKGSPIRSIP